MVWVDYMRTLSNPSSAKTNDLLHLQNTPLLKPTTDCPIIAKGAVMVANCNRQDRYLLPVWESAHLAAARAYSKPGMGMGLRLNESMTHPPPHRWRLLGLWIWVRPWVIAQQVIIGPLVDARTVAMTQNTGSDTFIVCSPRSTVERRAVLKRHRPKKGPGQETGGGWPSENGDVSSLKKQPLGGRTSNLAPSSLLGPTCHFLNEFTLSDKPRFSEHFLLLMSSYF